MSDHEGFFADPDFAARYAEGPPRFVPRHRTMLQMATMLLAEDTLKNAEVLVVGAGGGIGQRHLASRGEARSAPLSAPPAALRAAGVRFVPATGYAEGGSTFERLGAAAVLRKPYGKGDIERLIGSWKSLVRTSRPTRQGDRYKDPRTSRVTSARLKSRLARPSATRHSPAPARSVPSCAATSPASGRASSAAS